MKYKLTNLSKNTNRRITKKQVQAIRTGDLVKVNITDKNGDNGESIWIQVYGKVKGVYIGLVDSYPLGDFNLQYQSKIRFRPCNIVDIYGK